tara:strand:- start:1970 stop:2683 length:714 start_codon:yes stop_codon:yes gene_type:complete
MKTVIDKVMNAVSKLKGDLGNVSTPTSTDKYLYWCNESYFECLSFSDDISWELICSCEEFLATVAECETNFGKCIRYAEYKAEYERKEQLTIMLDELHKLADEPTPAYTQEMADNGVLPSVGMEFICGDEMANDERTVEFKGVKVKVIGVSAMGKDKVITFCHESLGVGCGIFFSSWVKPITPPITLIDGECYQFNSPSGGLFKGYYIPVKGLFVAHKGSFDAHLCTNIQPLTVEVK